MLVLSASVAFTEMMKRPSEASSDTDTMYGEAKKMGALSFSSRTFTINVVEADRGGLPRSTAVILSW